MLNNNLSIFEDTKETIIKSLSINGVIDYSALCNHYKDTCLDINGKEYDISHVKVVRDLIKETFDNNNY